MCGIIFEVLYKGPSVMKDDLIMQSINNRGPDCNHVIEIDIGNNVKASFCGAVLWMQGAEITAQPVVNDHGILLYNGDIFDVLWNKTISDTLQIMEKLSSFKNNHQIIREIKSLKGPHSIIYYDKSTSNLYFTRDRIGRNTLLFHKDKSSMIISSLLGRKYSCVEIPASHIHVLNLKTNEISLYSWTEQSLTPNNSSVEDWHRNLQKQQSSSDEAFAVEFETLANLENQDDVITFIENTVHTTKCRAEIMQKLLGHDAMRQTVIEITELLEKSVKIRLEMQPQKCKMCLHCESICNHCTVGVLFSGGLDCTILAFLADKYVPKEQSIDLLNVAFNKKEKGSYDVPDRLTGRQSFEELKKLCPFRKWVFKEINVPKEELETFQESTIADLVYPRHTILDESLGSALWFAARGRDENSTSTCRVLLVGSGADELFGGYTRHSNAYRRHGWAGLHQELQLDWSRISFRNLARDNRVICDHGRQPRMPYLDEDFSNYVIKLKPWLKCFPSDSLGKELGMKLMLRLVAFNLGLTQVMALPKRALQFGSRIANCKEKGSDLSKKINVVQIND